jgi:hypothetical protein
VHTVELKGPVEAIDITWGINAHNKNNHGHRHLLTRDLPVATYSKMSQKAAPPAKDQPCTWDPSTITPIHYPELLPSRSRFIFILMPTQGAQLCPEECKRIAHGTAMWPFAGRHPSHPRCACHLLHKPEIVGPVNCHTIQESGGENRQC